MEESLGHCCYKAMFPESHKLKLDSFQRTELWKSGRLRLGRIGRGFSSPSQVCILILLVLGIFPSNCHASCTELGRSVLTDLQGTITDGAGKYPEDEHCEWLIVAPSPNMRIQLTFKHFSTECTYDYLSIYDGDSFTSPKLGTFSGDRTPNPVVATSGKMLIYLYSDTNYNLNGTDATYTITNCTNNCSSRGTCDESTHTCDCGPGYIGDGCEWYTCPDSCGANLGHGMCDQNAHPYPKCKCNAGFVGESCSLSTNSNRGWGNTMLLSSGIQEPDSFTPRTGHGVVYHATTDSLYVFGGFTLNNVLGDLVKYDFLANEWSVLTPSGSSVPSGRYGHTMLRYDDEIIVFGGAQDNNTLSNELWSYHILNNQWTLLNPGSGDIPPGLTDHSASIVNFSHLYVFGGRSETDDFTSVLYKYDLSVKSGWEIVLPLGGPEKSLAVRGHSSVFHYDSQSFLVFGGFRPSSARLSERSNAVYAFHVEKRYWTKWYNNNNPPRERAFHTANIIGNYMVVYGGNVHIHQTSSNINQDLEHEKCYEDGVELYHLGCHQWVDFDTIAADFQDVSLNPYTVTRGRFGHASAIRNDTTLLIVGGYNGVTLKDTLAIKMPGTVAVNSETNDNTSKCNTHSSQNSCTANPDCLWCTSSAACLPHDQQNNCGTYVEGTCPGTCNVLSTCESCTIWGQQSPDMTYAPAWSHKNELCGWCVQDQRCYSIAAPEGYCGDRSSYAGPIGWWGRNGTFISDFSSCVTNDTPPGMTWVKYRHPKNESFPDELTIVDKTENTFAFEGESREHQNEGVYTAEYKGFLLPQGATPRDGDADLKVWMESSKATSRLFISSNDNPGNAEQVASISGTESDTEEAVRPSGGSIFPNHEAKYYVWQEEQQEIRQREVKAQSSHMKLKWNGNLETLERHTAFTAEYLMPYSSDSCSEYTTCMGCLVDAACGWCPISETCEQRNGPMLSVDRCGAGAGSVEHYLVTDVANCGSCDAHVDCLSCAEDKYCEWLADSDTSCHRRGRFSDAITEPAQCHGRCSQYTTCRNCSKQVHECAWCEGLQACFMFGTYITTYTYGQCSHWFDRKKECPDCSVHTTCNACLNDFQCGWCGNTDNPTIGLCHDGDFQGPDVSNNCSALIETHFNHTSLEPADWSYKICPDVEECRLGLDDCHANATCVNTPDSYICECKRGFVGNGKTICNKTCYHECEHGHCSGPPNYECICDIGWTGINCSTDCGCNYHSTCVNGIGLCDDCQHWTMGDHCELCQPGSYGNATNSPGCQECQCNGHGDASLGMCDNVTGICYCTENTQGDYCSECMDGFYGDPSNNEYCYNKCEGRVILTDLTSSALGSHNGSGVLDREKAYCLWILTVYNNLTDPVLLDPVPSISLTINKIDTACGRDYVHVYDGLPDDILVDNDAPGFIKEGRSLGSYCGHAQIVTPTVVATSGILTVVFQANISDEFITEGFTAVYQVNKCPNSCHGNMKCNDSGQCVCKEGYRGENCETAVCPDDCGASLVPARGTCDEKLGLCRCGIGYLGPACEYPNISPLLQGIWTNLYDPSLYKASGDGISDLTMVPIPRMGHSMVVSDTGKLWMFGGYSQDGRNLNDVWSYNLRTLQWEQVTPASSVVPQARHFHAAAFVDKSMYLVGGLTDSGVKDDFWEFNISTKNWTEITGVKNFPHVAGHTLTLVDPNNDQRNQKLVLIGGYSPEDGLLHAVVQYIVDTGVWVDIETTGTPPTGLYGHTTVWHMETEALYVYGGYRFHLNSIRISDKLYSFNYSTKEWSMLPAEAFYTPEPRMFHAAVTTSQYMLIIGGGTPTYNFTNTVLAYRFDCNKWLNFTAEELLVGSLPSPASSQAAVISGSEVYLYGGTNGQVKGDLRVLNVPEDLCSTRMTTQDCRTLLGCSACVASNDTNKLVFCRSNVHDNLNMFCGSPNVVLSGNKCTKKAVVEDRLCEEISLCSECVMRHPAHPTATQTCKWCSSCQDGEGKCLSIDVDCTDPKICAEGSQRDITTSNQCGELACEASDCEKCTASVDCMWTKQFMRSSETRRMLNSKPVYDWNCFGQNLLKLAPANYDIQRVPPNLCPIPCHEHSSCGDCLDSIGADGGWQECMWSATMRVCMSPTYLPLICATGECGPLYNGSSMVCPSPCYVNDQCDHCLKQPGCGWCGINNGNGTGVCMEGGLHGPLDGICTPTNVSLKYDSMPAVVNNHLERVHAATKPGSVPEWTFITCPPENECLNGHHDCMENEECRDTPDSYECQCKPGYEREKGKCKPVCHPTCINGECIEPNVCQCMFGFVGADCSVACQCNGHSECASVNTTDVCLECKDNTVGMNCERCLPLFVGNATNGGTCTPCSDLCHGNTEICISEVDYNLSVAAGYNLLLGNVVDSYPLGPVDPETTVCVKCGNFSDGKKCDTCIDGYFKDGVCKRCQCNGHWDMCDKSTGLGCTCQNNTQTPTCPSNSEPNRISEPCWQHQCSSCKELYLGTPTEDRQCYRQMQVEQDNCFEPQTQNTCPLDATLPQGRSSFFYVQPKYTNLDIRLTVDVTVGALDVFLTFNDSIFTALVNRTSGMHSIEYKNNPEYDYVYVDRREKREIFSSMGYFSHSRSRRSSELVDPEAQEQSTGSTEEPVDVRVFETIAKGINTFVTVQNGHFISVVRSLRNRLVVSLPHQFHQLKTKRFYIALVSHGTESHNATQGIMYFRQDQPQIDLFVFFSVFLSCFFLFLAVLVVAWKIKVGFEARNDRRMRQLEMEHRASRPFGKVMVYVDNLPPSQGPTQKRHRSTLNRLTRSGSSLSSDNTLSLTRPGSASKDPFHPGIIASEPTDDGIAAIGTLVISLPGNSEAPVKACLGSALITLKHAHRQQNTEPIHVRQPRYSGVKPMSASCRRSNNRRV